MRYRISKPQYGKKTTLIGLGDDTIKTMTLAVLAIDRSISEYSETVSSISNILEVRECHNEQWPIDGQDISIAEIARRRSIYLHRNDFARMRH
jgi:hypothetical protein